MKAATQRTICANTGNRTLTVQRVASHFSDWATAANTKFVLFSENVLCIITSINLRKLISHLPATYPFDTTRCRDVALTSIHSVGVSTWRHRTETQTKLSVLQPHWVTFHIRPTRREASYALNSDGKCFILAQQPPQWARASSFTRFLGHTQRRNTVGMTPLDALSARRRDLYLTTHNTHNWQASMSTVGFEPTISAVERSLGPAMGNVQH